MEKKKRHFSSMRTCIFIKDLKEHGTGSRGNSRRNQYVAEKLNEDGLATLLLDLLTAEEEEEEIDNQTRQLRFDISRLSKRLVIAIDWITNNPDTKNHHQTTFIAVKQ